MNVSVENYVCHTSFGRTVSTTGLRGKIPPIEGNVDSPDFSPGVNKFRFTQLHLDTWDKYKEEHFFVLIVKFLYFPNSMDVSKSFPFHVLISTILGSHGCGDMEEEVVQVKESEK